MAVIRILRYLKSYPRRGLILFKNNHLNIDGYIDDDWVGDVFDRKSTSGYFTFVGGNLVTWRSKKQKVVSISSVAEKFSRMAKGLCKLYWTIKLLSEIGFTPNFKLNLFYDNKATIEISHNMAHQDHTKHIEVGKHFIKQNLDEKIIQFPLSSQNINQQICLQRPFSVKVSTTHQTSCTSKTFMHQLGGSVGVSCIFHLFRVLIGIISYLVWYKSQVIWTYHQPKIEFFPSLVRSFMNNPLYIIDRLL